MCSSLKSNSLNDEQRKVIEDILAQNNNSAMNILDTLLKIQDKMPQHYIGEDVCKIVSQKTGIKIIDLYDICTFYAMINTVPQADNVIEVCHCGSCYINNSASIMSILEKKLGIKEGEMTSDKKIALKTCPCVGACDIGPVVKIGEKVYGNLTEKTIDEIILSLKGEN